MYYLQCKNDPDSTLLDGNKISIGKHPDNTIVIQDPSIDDFQAEISARKTALFLRHLGGPGSVYVNDRAISFTCQIYEGDELIFGTTAYLIKASTMIKPTKPADADMTVIQSKNNDAADVTRLHQRAATTPPSTSPQKWNLKCKNLTIADISLPTRKEFTVGRNTNCDFVISEGLLSRKHALFFADEDHVQVKDLDSSNGTFINNDKISAGIAKDGDIIGLGTANFELTLIDKPESVSVAPALPPTLFNEPTNKLTDDNNVEAPSPDNSEPATIHSPSSSKPSGVWQATPQTTDGTVIMPVMLGKPDTPHLIGDSDPVDGIRFNLSKSTITIGRNTNNDIHIDEISISSNHAQILKEGNQWELIDLRSTNGTFLNQKQINRNTIKSGDIICFGQINFSVGGLGTTSSQIKTPGGTERISDNRKPQNFGLKKVFTIIGAIAAGVLIAVGIYFNMDNLSKLGSAPVEEPLALNPLWQKSIPGSTLLSAPIIQNINNNGNPEIIVSNDNGHVFVINGSNGKNLFTIRSKGKKVTVLTSDLDNNGLPDIILSSDDGSLKVIDLVGNTRWEVNKKPYIEDFVNDPVMRDINQDDVPDIIAPTRSSALVAINGKDGSLLWSSKKHTKGSVLSKALVNDINNDGFLDFISLTHSGQLLATTFKNGKLSVLWSINVPPVLFASPILLKTDTHKLIVIATHQQGIIAIDAVSAKIVWKKPSKQSFFATPVAISSENFSSQDLLLISFNGDIITLNGSTGVEKSRKSLPGKFQTEPNFYDLNNDGHLDIILADTEGRIYFVDGLSSNILLSSTIPNVDSFTKTPAIGDINQDGTLNLVFTTPAGEILAYEVNRPYTAK